MGGRRRRSLGGAPLGCQQNGERSIGAVTNTDRMKSQFAGSTADFYARYRRDLPAAQASEIADRVGLRSEDLVVDLGCGTGQLAAPFAKHCTAVIAIDPEPAMLKGLRDRSLDGILCVLGDDKDLSRLFSAIIRPVGLVTIGNALHWMDELSTLQAASDLVRPGGAIVIVTQGPPLWLGPAPWQRTVRLALEQIYGPVSGNCRSDQSSLDERFAMAVDLGLDTQVLSWRTDYEVDLDAVLGHLSSALSSDQTDKQEALAKLLLPLVDVEMVEQVATTALVAVRPA